MKNQKILLAIAVLLAILTIVGVIGHFIGNYMIICFFIALLARPFIMVITDIEKGEL